MLPDFQGNEFWQGLCTGLSSDVGAECSVETMAFAGEFTQTAVRRSCLSTEYAVPSPSVQGKWTERFRNKQQELGIEGIPAFLQDSERLQLQSAHATAFDEPSIDQGNPRPGTAEQQEVPQTTPELVHTPSGPALVSDVFHFKRSLVKPFTLIHMGVFGQATGFCVCDVTRAIIPICFLHKESQTCCMHYFARGTTAKEIQARWAHRKDFSIELCDDFVVRHWGQVLEVVFFPKEHITIPCPEAKVRALLSLENMLVTDPGLRRDAVCPVPANWEERVHCLWHDPLSALPEGMKVHA